MNPGNKHTCNNILIVNIHTVKCLYFAGYIFRELACKTWFAKVIFTILGLSIHGMAIR